MFSHFFCTFAYLINRMRVVDTRGQQCPGPIIATRKALREANEGESVRVITDNLTSFGNLCRFLKDNGMVFNTEESDGLWILTVNRSGEISTSGLSEEYCTAEEAAFPRGEFVIAFTSDRMGEGSDELGQLLMVNFFRAVKDLDLLPRKLIFYNSGVKLASEGSDVVKHIEDLGKMGVEILICATCISYYDLAGKTSVGQLSNMYEIAQAMASAGNIVRP